MKNEIQKSAVNDLTQGAVWKKLLAFFFPVALGTIVQQLYSTADALIVGRYVGTQALAAIGGSPTQIINLLIGFFVALTSGASIVVAQLYGEKNEKDISRASNTSVLACTICGIVVGVLGMLATPTLLKLMKTPADTMSDSVVYLTWCFGGTMFVLIYNMGAGILRAVGDSKRPFFYLLCCCLTNIVLDYVCVKILGLGVGGAAIATVFSQFISCALVLIRLFKAEEAYKVRFSELKISGRMLKKMLRLGFPSGVQQIMYGVSNSYIQIAVNILGTANVAAWTLTGKVDGVYWALISASGTAIMSFVGQNYGAGKIDRVKESLKKGLLMFMAMTVILAAAILLLGRSLFPFFLDDAEVVDIASYVLCLFVPFYPIWTIIEVYGGVLKGAGDAFVPAAFTVVGIALLRVVWVATIFKIYTNITVLAIVYPVSWLVTAIPMVIRYAKGHWNKIEIKHSNI